MGKVTKSIFKWIGIILFFVFAVFITLVILIQQPKVQTWAVQKAAHYLSEKTGTNISVDKVDIKFFRTVSIGNVYLEDKNKDTLAYIRSLDTKLSYFNPFKKQFHFSTLSLDGVRANIYNTDTDSIYNYQFLLDAFSSGKKEKTVKNADKKKSSSNIDIDVNQIYLSDIAVLFDNQFGGQGHDIKLKSLDVDVKNFDLNDKNILLKNVNIVQPYYVLTTHKKSKKEDKESSPFDVNIGFLTRVNKLQIKDGHFGMHDETKERTHAKNGFEFSYFDVSKINLDLKDFQWDSTMAVHIQHLSAQSLENNVDLKLLSVAAKMDNHSIQAKDLTVNYNQTKVAGNALLEFGSFEDFGDFLNKVKLSGNIAELQTTGNDVGVWARVAQQYVPGNVNISGAFNGEIANLSTKNLKLKVNQSTVIDGDATIKGIPNPDKMYITANIRQLKTRGSDIHQIIPYVKLPSIIDSIGNFQAVGTYEGYINNFKANTKIKTDIGDLIANVHLDFSKKGPPSYNGQVQSSGLKIEKLLGIDKLTDATFDLMIHGSGFDLNSVNTSVKGTISSIEYNYYKYKNIDLDGTINNKVFDGKVSMHDDCAIIDFNGSANLSNPEKPIYNFHAKLQDGDLQQLNLIPNRLIVSVEGDFNFEGANINNLIGQAKLSNISLKNEQINVDLSDLTVSLEKQDDYKKYTIESDEINGYMRGYFDPIKLPASLQYYISNHTTLVNAPGIEKLDHLIYPQDVEMNIRVSKDIGVLSFFVPQIKSFSDIDLSGTYNSEKNKINLNLNADSLIYNNIHFHGFNTNIFDRNDSLIIVGDLKNLEVGNASFNGFHLGATSNLSGFYSRLKVENDSAANNLNLTTIVNFDKDSTKIRFPNSKIKINNKTWVLNNENNILIHDTIFKLNKFDLVQGDQSIIIRNRQNLSTAFVGIRNLHILDITQLFDKDNIIKDGVLDARIRLKNILKSPNIDGDITLRRLNILDEKIDTIKLNAQLSDSDKSLDIDGSIIDENYQLSVKGDYSLDKNNLSPINLNAKIKKLSLKFLSFPFILGHEISNLNAFAKGDIQVKGSFNNIALDGKANIIDTASVKINFLGTTLKFANEDIVLKPNSIEFYKGGLMDKTITLFDDNNNTATLRAKLEHKNFKDFTVDASIISDKFKFLNSTYKDNQDFFGTVYASGVVNISGPIDNINMDISARTLPNTEFNIVVAGSADDELYDFVKFTDRSNPKDTIKINKEAKPKSGSKLNMVLNIAATQDALLKLYLDYNKNDVIKARGNGDLQLLIDPNSMRMIGDYVVASGEYLFSQQDIINKKFTLKNGSTISWSGDIMEAKMDVDAFYSSRVSMNDIVDSTSNLRNRKFPVDVVLKIGGTLSNTEINFALEPSKNQSNIPDELTAVLDRINSDPAQVNTQAFGLILFNRFLNLQGANTSSANNIGVDMAMTTLSEFFNAKISGYVNDALSTLIPGAEVDISQGTDNTGIRLTQKLSNDRLIINIGGDVQYGNSKDNLKLQENNTGFVGDVEIEYLVTEDGRISAKVYSRYDNTIIRLDNESYIKSGIGITYQKEVDKFGQLFKFDRKRKKGK
ncbi:MAG: translocation/assembly module TamB [Chitinophagales bacterium]|nr:translocation/assembly module TamB [Chitinophagales bacterium]